MELRLSASFIENHIYLIRGQKVMLDSDLAQLYEVSTRRLKEQVRRNLLRFPGDFMLALTSDEAVRSRSQNAALKQGQNIKYLPYAFTEQGVAMLSSVLKSPRAVLVNIEIMRAFVRLRQMLSSNQELAQKLADLEEKYDAQFKVVFDAIRDLMAPPKEPPRQIGFQPNR